MKAIICKRPWIVVLAFYLTFIAVWIWFATFASQHSPAKYIPSAERSAHAPG